MRSSLCVARVALVTLAVVVGLFVLPSRAHAFADAAQFFDNKSTPHAATFGASGEGLYFTGAPRYASLECSSCHSGGPQKLGLRLNAEDPTLFATGYEPGKTYQLQVELRNESKGLQYKTATCTDTPTADDNFTYVQCNNNGFALEIDASTGPLGGAGVYCAQSPKAGKCPAADATLDESLIAPDGDAVFESKVYSADPNQPKLVTRNPADSWRFWWTAPKAGSGPLTVYVTAVDGNGGAGTVANDQDPFDDDTVAASFFLQEANVPVHNAASAGCGMASAAPPGSPSSLVALAVLLLALALRSARRTSPRQERMKATSSSSESAMAEGMNS